MLQVRKLVQKVIKKDSFHYRKFTDQTVAKEGETTLARNTMPFDLDAIAKGMSHIFFACFCIYF